MSKIIHHFYGNPIQYFWFKDVDAGIGQMRKNLVRGRFFYKADNIVSCIQFYNAPIPGVGYMIETHCSQNTAAMMLFNHGAQISPGQQVAVENYKGII